MMMIGPLPNHTEVRYALEDGGWVISCEVPTQSGNWRTWSFSRPLFCHVFDEPPPYRMKDQRPRALVMQAARARGTHTTEEWRRVVVASGRQCTYCLHPIPGRIQKDHMTPVSRGGSDAIENLAPCCVRCNSTKCDLTADEFRRFYRPEKFPPPHPRRRRRAS